MVRVLKWSILVLFVAFLAIQLVPVDRSNPPVETEIPASPQVRAVLQRACYDCHSNQTVWPWYARIAPASWVIARDVHEGRKALNFSTWNRLEMKDQIKAIHEVWEEVAESEMPPAIYMPFHPEANLSADDLSLLRSWVGSTGFLDVDDD